MQLLLEYFFPSSVPRDPDWHYLRRRFREMREESEREKIEELATPTQ